MRYIYEQKEVKNENAVCHRSSVIVCSRSNEHVYHFWHSNHICATRVCMYTAMVHNFLTIIYYFGSVK